MLGILSLKNNGLCSGAEDRQAYVWDRHYGICLAKNGHKDVVNSVAFNPTDSEMLVTTSDDCTIKVCNEFDWLRNANQLEFQFQIWRSINKARGLGIGIDD